MTTTREKKIIVQLHRLGLDSSMLAKVFGMRRQQVAAYVAWDTLRKRK